MNSSLASLSQSSQAYSSPQDANMFEYKRKLLKCLSKFGAPHTVVIGQEEIRKFMSVEITDHEHMVLFLSLLAEENNHMKLQ